MAKTPKLDDVLGILEEIAPAELAESWDNCGLQVGRGGWPVERIWVSLDPLPEVVAAACRQNVDLLVTHHPLIYKPLSAVDFDSPVGASIEMAALHRMAIFSAHTNLDAAAGGINEVLADKISLADLSNLVQSSKAEGDPTPRPGIGRVGELETPMTLEALANHIKEKMGLESVRVTGDPQLMIKRVAVCSGSGASLMNAFFLSGAQVFISGDLKYHDAREAQQRHLALIDMGHFASEHLMVAVLVERIRDGLKRAGLSARVAACELEKEPFSMI